MPEPLAPELGFAPLNASAALAFVGFGGLEGSGGCGRGGGMPLNPERRLHPPGSSSESGAASAGVPATVLAADPCAALDRRRLTLTGVAQEAATLFEKSTK